MAIMAEYIKYINGKSFTNNTKEAYISDCNMFMNYVLEKNLKIYDIDNIFVLTYLNRLKKEKKANSTITRNLSSINNLLNFMYRKKYLKEPVITEFESPLVQKSMPVFLTVDEVDNLMGAQDLNSFKGLRDRTMLELMYACGLKVSELLTLTVYDIDTSQRLIYIRKNGKKTRMVPVGSIAIEFLNKYLKKRDDKNKLSLDVLFFNMNSKPLTRQGFWKIVKEYSKNADIKKNINTYTLRHSFAIHLIQNGADISAVQRILGHKNIMATAVYKDFIDKEKIREVYDKAHPRA